MFAITVIAGKQYTVSPGDMLDVDRIEGKTGDSVIFDRVLLFDDGKKTSVGTPTVKGVAVKAKIAGQEQGEKVRVRRYKSKVRYRKSIGFRPQRTKLEIISVG